MADSVLAAPQFVHGAVAKECAVDSDALHFHFAGAAGRSDADISDEVASAPAPYLGLAATAQSNVLFLPLQWVLRHNSTLPPQSFGLP
jgi:hypothetical protein